MASKNIYNALEDDIHAEDEEIGRTQELKLPTASLSALPPQKGIVPITTRKVEAEFYQDKNL